MFSQVKEFSFACVCIEIPIGQHQNQVHPCPTPQLSPSSYAPPVSGCVTGGFSYLQRNYMVILKQTKTTKTKNKSASHILDFQGYL